MKFLVRFVAAVMAGMMCWACSSDGTEPLPAPTDVTKGYCLMFYCSGGDPAHDVTIMQSAESAASAANDSVSVTCLFKKSGSEGGVRWRYTAVNGELVADGSFMLPALRL